MEKIFNKQLIKVAVTGPESTGKTTLAESIASKYNTIWVPEYAREYIEKLEKQYTKQDVEKIAQGQIDNTLKAEKIAKKILICDTELIVIKIWMEVRYGECPKWIIEQINKQNFDLYLLCYPDIPWEYDKLREHPEMREILFELYEKELQRLNFNYCIIKGDKKERLINASKQINTILYG